MSVCLKGFWAPVVEDWGEVKTMLYFWRPDCGLEMKANEEFMALKSEPGAVLWLDLEGDEESLCREMVALGNLHPLSFQRIFSKQPRAFLEEFEEYLHILLQEILYDDQAQESRVQVGVCHFIIGSNYLISIHSQSVEAFQSFQRVPPPGRFFQQGSDLLFYYLTEPLIGATFKVLDRIAELTEDIEDRIFPKPDQKLLNELFRLKKDLITLRKTLAPMREVLGMLSRRENPFVDEQALLFMSHLYDQLIRLHEISDTQREIVSGALEIYLSSMSNRMNEIMKTLTIVSTVILPSTLVVGYYGMNFEMPEFGWKYGHLLVLFFIGIIISGMLIYFNRKHWF
jgi:magnesium transporter